MDLWFRNSDGRARDPFEFASLPEAREVFREMKRTLDVMDDSRDHPGLDFEWNAMDRAVFALRLSLQRQGSWTEDLMATELVPEVEPSE